MPITNVVIVSTGPGTSQITFDSDIVTNISDVNAIVVNWGPDINYGNSSSGQPTANIPGGISCVAAIGSDPTGVFFEITITDFNSNEQDYFFPPPSPPPVVTPSPIPFPDGGIAITNNGSPLGTQSIGIATRYDSPGYVSADSLIDGILK